MLKISMKIMVLFHEYKFHCRVCGPGSPGLEPLARRMSADVDQSGVAFLAKIAYDSPRAGLSGAAVARPWRRAEPIRAA